MVGIQETFNDMANEYDDLSDLWYSWLFSRLHYIIAKKVVFKDFPKRMLDIGCGTGFQSYLYSAAGCNVIGIDIANDLIEVAKNKEKKFDPIRIKLFPVHFDYVQQYNQLIRSTIKKKIGKVEYCPPRFFYGDAMNIPYNDKEFDHVNCCGSTLSFVSKHKIALSEMSRVLKPGGTFLLEVEHRWNFNFIWYLLDPLVHGKFHFNKSIREGLKFLTKKFNRNIWINFPFGESNKPVYMNLKLFTTFSLKRDLMKYGLKVEKKYSIHALTNLIPCTYLDSLKPSKKLTYLFKKLAHLEEKFPFYLPGSSLVLYGKKLS